MSKKHFEKLAQMVRSLPLTPNDRQQVAIGVADVCAGANDRFDRHRFLAACGL